ncbi:MAG: hypothetical protein U9R79_00970 [Armatimonadota bacterium]|nr:hypothetical protein [Armatimonadota bacterium]
MRRYIVPAALAALAVLVAASLVWAATIKIVVEGEDYYSIKPSMAKHASEVASGKAYIHIPLRRPHAATETEPSDDGNARFRIRVPASGVYRLWARGHWYDSCGNSFFLIVDDKPATVIGEDGTYQKWHWVKGPRLQLSAGVHIIRIQNKEDGAKLDQFMLTNNSRYVPVRAEKRTPQYIIKPDDND